MSTDFSLNYFELFGLPPKFEIDKQKLQQQQRQLQSALHPDRFVNSTAQEKRLSVQKASLVNEASMTLKDPVRRARHLLEIAGMTLNDESETTSDMAFLMEQISFREEMEECRSNADPIECCEHVTQKLNQRMQQFSGDFILAYEKEDMEQARQHSRKMQFVQRILEQLAELELELENELN